MFQRTASIFVAALAVCVSDAGAETGPPEVAGQAVGIADGATTSAPIVPLPPGVYGALASVGMAVALRCSKHRRWITLRG